MKRIVFGESVQGASHKRVDKECQDSFKKIEFDDGTVIMAIADGHGSKSCPYSKSGSSIAVNVFCKVMDEFHTSYAENLEMLLTYLNREGDTKVAQAVDAEWKRRVLKAHTNHKREVPFTEDGEKNKVEIYKQYGSTLVGLMITPIFIFAFQLGDGDISFVDNNGFDHPLEDEKILGVETHSLSKIDSWKKVVSAVRRRDESEGLPYMLMLSTDGFANSYKNADEFQKTCVDYFAMIKQYGADAVATNLKGWLSETSAMGCGDDITVLIAYCSNDDEKEINVSANGRA
jgi:serine/threonine protein phosphatase PrpC